MAKQKKLHLALLAGGTSGERDVSLQGAVEVYKALNPDKYKITRYDPATDLTLLAANARQIDAAFILLHGPLGEDGAIQGFLEMLDIPYQGSGVLGSSMAMDKNLSKILFQYGGLTVPDWFMTTTDDLDRVDLSSRMMLPVIIKPKQQGSSLGMSIVTSKHDFTSALKKGFEFDREVMIEQYISGREITVAVLGNDKLVPLPLVEIIPDATYSFFDYEAKYRVGASREICPANFSPAITKTAQEIAITAHQILKLRGYSRTDMIVDNNNNIYVLETNTIPGMTPTSLLPQAAAAHGLSFSSLLDLLIEMAIEPRS